MRLHRDTAWEGKGSDTAAVALNDTIWANGYDNLTDRMNVSRTNLNYCQSGLSINTLCLTQAHTSWMHLHTYRQLTGRIMISEWIVADNKYYIRFMFALQKTANKINTDNMLQF